MFSMTVRLPNSFPSAQIMTGCCSSTARCTLNVKNQDCSSVTAHRQADVRRLCEQPDDWWDRPHLLSALSLTGIESNSENLSTHRRQIALSQRTHSHTVDALMFSMTVRLPDSFPSAQIMTLTLSIAWC
jgi:muconolactone delta-isomerase